MNTDAFSSPPGKKGSSVSRFFQRKDVLVLLTIILVAAVVLGVAYWMDQQRYVYTDKVQVDAPLIKLSPIIGGVLKEVYVSQGDRLYAHETVARIGDEMIKTQVSGIAVIVNKDIGSLYGPGQAVVTMVDPTQLRLIAQVQEDKGLALVHSGEPVKFTVDAFDGKEFEGRVESVSETSHAGDVVFNISDQRQTQNFDVKIWYDVNRYPELQNGMSAKVWILKQ